MPHLHARAASETSGRVEPGRGVDLTPMTLALCVSLCTLPFVFLLVAPRFGFQAALGTALVIVAGITIVCWLLCASTRLHGTRGWRRGE